MKSVLILLFTAFIFTHSFSQNFELKKDKGAFGIYDPTSKKWKTPATYSSINEFGYKEAGANIVICYLATNKKGQLLISNDGVTKLTKEYTQIDNVYGSKDYFILNDNSKLCFYKLGEGILTSFGTFDGYFNEGYASNLLYLTKGNKHSFLLPPNLLYPSFDFDTKVESTKNYIIGKKNGKYGALNTEGTTIAEFQYDSLIGEKNTNYSFIFAKKNNKWGILNDTGDEMIPCEYDDMDPNFGRWYWRQTEKSPEFIPVKIKGKWGTIDLQKNILLNPEYDSLLYITWQQEIGFIKNGKRGLTNFTGKIIFPANYTYFEKLQGELGIYLGSHLYLVNNGCTTCDVYKGEGKWGLADSSGKIIIEPSANIIPLFNHKYSEAKNTEFVNGTLEDEIRFYHSADSFNVGFLWNIGGTKTRTLMYVDSLMNEDGIDEMGNLQVQPRFIYHYSYNIEGGKTGVISPTGKIIIPIEYDDFSFKLRHKWKEIDDQIESITEPSLYQPENYSLSDLQNYFAKKNGKWGYYAWPNKQIIEPIYDSLQFFNNNYDMSDSMYTALGYHKKVIIAFMDKTAYYISNTGELLYKQIPGERFYGEVSFPKKVNPKIYPEFDSYYIIVSNSQPKAFTSSTTMDVDEIDEVGNSHTVARTYTEQIITPVGGTIKFLHKGTFKLLLDEPITDFELTSHEAFYSDVYRQPRQVKWSDLSQRMRCFFRTSDFREISLDSITNINRYRPDLGTFQSSFIITRNEKNGLVNTDGKTLFPAKFTHFQKMSTILEGTNSNLYLINNGCTNCDVYEGDGKWGLADSTGKIILEANASIIPLKNHEFSNYSIPTTDLSLEQLKRYQKTADSVNVGFLWNVGGTKTKTILAVDSFDYEYYTPEGNIIMSKRPVYTYSYNFAGGKTGIVSKDGKILIPFEYEDLGLTVFGKNLYGGEGGQLNLRSLNQKHRALDQTYWFSGFKNYFGKKNGKWGYFAWPNKELIEPAYDSLEFFYNDYDLNDSMYFALGYHRKMLKAHDGKIVYYYADNGKLLYKQLANEQICSTISLKKSDITYIYPFKDEYYVVSIDAKPKAFESKRTSLIEEIDEMGNFYTVEKEITEQLITSVGGTLNLLDKGSFKFLFKEPVQDICFPGTFTSTGLDSYSRYTSSLTWSDVNARMMLQFRNSNFKEIPLSSVSSENKNTLPNCGDFGDYLIFKQHNKYYIQKTNDTVPFNKNIGFDSIRDCSFNSYKAYLNGKFGVFRFDFKGPFVFETDLRFPDHQGNYNIVCKDSKYHYKTIYQEREEQVIDPNTGEMVDSKWVIDTVKIPFVEKGKFNITNPNDSLILNQWYEEILFPLHDGSGNFSIQDSSSFIYHPYRYMNSNYPEYIKRCNESLAVRDGSVWKLIDLKNKDLVIDGIQHVKAVDGSWIVTINGKKYRYSITNVFGGREDVEE